MVISNKWMDGSRAWFKLLHTIRVQNNSEDGYQCVFECEDSEGYRGVRLSKEIVKVAGKTMEKNLTMLGPLVLPWSEQAKVAFSIVKKLVGKKVLGKKFGVYVPDFKRGVDHFCIHAGGRAVIDGKFSLHCCVVISEVNTKFGGNIYDSLFSYLCLFFCIALAICACLLNFSSLGLTSIYFKF
jgi:hypothetical protein